MPQLTHEPSVQVYFTQSGLMYLLGRSRSLSPSQSPDQVWDVDSL